MNHKLLTEFVFSGMQKNKKTLIPYLLAGTMTVMIYYILQSLAHCPYIYKDGVEAVSYTHLTLPTILLV